MIRKDKALLENLTKKYGKINILNELNLGPKEIKQSPAKEFKYLKVEPTGFTIVVDRDKYNRPMDFMYRKGMDELYYTDKKEGVYRRSSINGLHNLVVYDKEKIDEIIKYFEKYNPKSKYNNRRIYDHMTYL